MEQYLNLKVNKKNNYDSKLIKELIELQDNCYHKQENIEIPFNVQYQFSFRVIKNNTLPDIKELSKEQINNLVLGLMYFCSQKLLDDLLFKVAKEIREKYNNRKGVETFFRILCDFNLSLFKKNYQKHKISDWKELCENPNISDEFMKNYIIKKGLENWEYVCKNSNLTEKFFEKYAFTKKRINIKYLFRNVNNSDGFMEKNNL